MPRSPYVINGPGGIELRRPLCFPRADVAQFYVDALEAARGRALGAEPERIRQREQEARMPRPVVGALSSVARGRGPHSECELISISDIGGRFWTKSAFTLNLRRRQAARVRRLTRYRAQRALPASSLVLAASISSCVASPLKLRAMLFMMKARSSETSGRRARSLYCFARARHCVELNIEHPRTELDKTSKVRGLRLHYLSVRALQQVNRENCREAFRTRAAHPEGTSSPFAHSAARSLICSYLRVTGLPCRTMVAVLRSSRGKVIALATAERNLMEP
jgi:hypothetical protein